LQEAEEREVAARLLALAGLNDSKCWKLLWNYCFRMSIYW
jgi:hypothetical protein